MYEDLIWKICQAFECFQLMLPKPSSLIPNHSVTLFTVAPHLHSHKPVDLSGSV